MAAAPSPRLPSPIRYPQPSGPSNLLGGFIQLLLQITQMMMSRFQFGGGYPGGGGNPYQLNFGQQQQPNPFQFGGQQHNYFV